MSIICISHDSYSQGQVVAEIVSERLGYDCVGREMVQKAADAYSVGRKSMQKSLHDAPCLFDSLSNSKERNVDLFKAALLRAVRSGDVVYHGLAGHILLSDVKNVLKVRIVADKETRIRISEERDGLTRSQALARIADEDTQRLKWSKRLFGVDNHDPSLYSLCLNLSAMTVEEAVETIVEMSKSSAYQAGARELENVEYLARAAEIEARLLKSFDTVHVDACDQGLTVRLQAPLEHEGAVARRASRLVKRVNNGKYDFSHVTVAVDISAHV